MIKDLEWITFWALTAKYWNLGSIILDRFTLNHVFWKIFLSEFVCWMLLNVLLNNFFQIALWLHLSCCFFWLISSRSQRRPKNGVINQQRCDVALAYKSWNDCQEEYLTQKSHGMTLSRSHAASSYRWGISGVGDWLDTNCYLSSLFAHGNISFKHMTQMKITRKRKPDMSWKTNKEPVFHPWNVSHKIYFCVCKHLIEIWK